MLGGQGRETRAGKVRLTYIATWPRSFPSTVAPPISSTKLLIAMARRIVGALGCSRRTPCPKSYLDCHLKYRLYEARAVFDTRVHEGPGLHCSRQNRVRGARSAMSDASHSGGTTLRQYVREHQVEPMLAEALKSACDANATDPVSFIGNFMLLKAREQAGKREHENDSSGSKSDVAAYLENSAFGVAKQRTGWLLFFLFGLLLCANVMREFEGLLARELELAFFVPLLIGHGGNSGGQTVSTVIRALGSGMSKLSDAPRIIVKEAAAGCMQAIVLASALAPSLHFGMGISIEVTTIVSLTLPCLGFGANALGASLPFLISWLGFDPAVIVGPLMTTTVDSCGLMTYLGIATAFFAIFRAESATIPSQASCRWKLSGCRPSNPDDVGIFACKAHGLKCLPA